MFSTPTPLNSFLWRVVVLTDDGYAEGFDSLLIDEGHMQFSSYTSDTDALAAAADIWAVQRLRWFAGDFVRADVVDQRLVITDLRMGLEPDYVFRHVVAEQGNVQRAARAIEAGKTSSRKRPTSPDTSRIALSVMLTRLSSGSILRSRTSASSD